MRIRSVLTATAVALGMAVLPAGVAEAAAKTPAQQCAAVGSTKGIFIQAKGGTLCLVAKGLGTYKVRGAYGCGPLKSGGKGYVLPDGGGKISCNAWVNFANKTVAFVVQ
ncbi:hypothetical protein [Allokutzneria oryzae]|uniref:Uncharacterized protein n=1 Tax=Allokutzneria oryzae TaxID=1378989 RepID=A0ABV5ZZ22_9PSEU